MFVSQLSSLGNGAALPNTAVCSSRSSQIFCSDAVSAQMPSHFGHSRKFVFPMTTACMFTWHRGQSSVLSVSTSVRASAAPQCGQNLYPANTIPKHDGHATICKRAPQCSHCVAPAETGAPHDGQFIASGVAAIFIPRILTEKSAHANAHSL